MAKTLSGGGTSVVARIGGGGDDTYVLDGASDVVIEAANGGTDTVVGGQTVDALAAEIENLTLTGTAALNATGNALDNVITGNAGNNVLDGGTGADTLIGGTGDDTYYVDSASDAVTELATSGTDTIFSSVSITALAENVENLTLTGTAALNATGNALDNVITGNTGNNVLYGGGGRDTFKGSLGDDTYYFGSSGGSVSGETANGGIDTIFSSSNYYMDTGTNIENLTLIGTESFLRATGNELNNVLIGSEGANLIEGRDGNDILDGRGGDDSLMGGKGNDTYVFDSISDTATENLNEGIDTIQTSVTLASLAANVENLTLIGTGAINGTGNTLNNVITGNAANNTLSGGIGDDVLKGGLGSNILSGGAGSDRYDITLGSGVNTIDNAEGDNATQDVISIDGVDKWSVWFGRSNNDLIVSFLGSGGTAKVTNWFSNTTAAVDKVELPTGGASVDAAGINALVSAMAAFSTPNGLAQTGTTPSNYSQDVTLAISTSWT